MSLLFRVLYAVKCTGTHHKLALDALRLLRGERAEAWRDFFLTDIENYLGGAKAPDDRFKDFKNHVLHVRENYWGGAIEAARDWFGKSVTALKEKRWSDAAFAVGVLGHYFTDPCMPLHTGQTEDEGPVHRALEWSISRSYDALRTILETDLGGWPKVEAPQSGNWLAQMIRHAAEQANPHYQVLIDHYDLARGVKDPPAGLDQELKDRLAGLIGVAAAGLSRVIDRVIDEAGVEPPRRPATLYGLLSAGAMPVMAITKRLASEADRKAVAAAFAEFEATGKVVKQLPEDDRAVRRLHAEEVLRVPVSQLDEQKIRQPGQKFGQGAPARGATPKDLKPTPIERPKKKEEPVKAAPAAVAAKPAERPTPNTVQAAPLHATGGPTDRGRKYHVELDAPVVDAPSIGSKTAERLERCGVVTVRDLLEADPDDLARQLALKHVEPETVQAWQDQTQLMLRVAGLRGHDAQLLTGVGVCDAETLARSKPRELLAEIEAFAATSDGERVLRGSEAPDLREVGMWIASARQARSMKAA